jgi:hypothetical protein
MASCFRYDGSGYSLKTFYGKPGKRTCIYHGSNLSNAQPKEFGDLPWDASNEPRTFLRIGSDMADRNGADRGL